jgi:hypothetical protein
MNHIKASINASHLDSETWRQVADRRLLSAASQSNK